MNKVTVTLIINMDTLKKVIELTENIRDKVFINKLKRAYNRREKEKTESCKRIYNSLVPGSNN